MSDKIAPRDVIGKTLVALGENNPNIAVLDADFNTCTKTLEFKKRFPERFVQVGIAEQNMIGIAAGLATVGFIPFASTICTFSTRRPYDQIVTSIAISKLNVKILGVYSGLFVGKNGASHQSLEDIAIMRAVANMTVIEPVDSVETELAIRFAAEYEGPVYIRIGRDPAPIFTPSGYKFQLGKSLTIREGEDLTIITSGCLMEDVLKSVSILAEQGIQARVINMSSIKPIDKDAIIKAAKETGKIVTVENHNILGGLGSAVCEVVTESIPVRVKRIGIKDVVGASGTNEEMKEKYGLRAEDIARETLAFFYNG